MVSGDRDWTALSKHCTRKIENLEGIANSNGVESNATQVAPYCSSVSTPLVMHREISIQYLIET